MNLAESATTNTACDKAHAAWVQASEAFLKASEARKVCATTCDKAGAFPSAVCDKELCAAYTRASEAYDRAYAKYSAVVLGS